MSWSVLIMRCVRLRLLHTAPADVVGHVHGLVRARVRTPGTTEALAVLTETALERGVQGAVGDRDRDGVVANLPPVREGRRPSSHSPGSDETVQSLEGGIRRGYLCVCHRWPPSSHCPFPAIPSHRS